MRFKYVVRQRAAALLRAAARRVDWQPFGAVRWLKYESEVGEWWVNIEAPVGSGGWGIRVKDRAAANQALAALDYLKGKNEAPANHVGENNEQSTAADEVVADGPPG